MAEKKVGILVREARTGAWLTQDRLAKTVGEGLTAADISKCERGEKDLTNAQLKKIAVACGVTQTSLVNAPKNLSETKTASRGTAGKTAASGKTGTAGKTTASASGKTAAKTTASGRRTM
jgi:ribosome-binding protein aMBF1 (putative translation factor)